LKRIVTFALPRILSCYRDESLCLKAALKICFVVSIIGVGVFSVLIKIVKAIIFSTIMKLKALVGVALVRRRFPLQTMRY
jgi:hypothetical protein